MKDNGKMERSMAMEFTHGLTNKDTKVNTKTVRCMVTESIHGLTDKDTKAIL